GCRRAARLRRSVARRAKIAWGAAASLRPAALDAQNPKTRDRERQHTYPDGGLSRLARKPAWPALRRLRVAAPLVGHRPRRLLVFDPGVLPAHRRGEAGAGAGGRPHARRPMVPWALAQL